MQRNKKGFSLLLAVVMVLTLILAGCTKKSDSGAESTATAGAAPEATQEATAEPTATPLPEVKLTYYFGGGWPQPDQELVFKKANEYIKSKINATIDFKPVGWADYDQKMKVVIASGEDYDIAFTAPWINNYAQNVAKGAFLPLDDLLTQYAPKSFETLKNYWDASRINGKIYGFINEQIFARTAAVVTDKDMADKYNFEGTYKVGDLSSLTPYVDAVYKEDPKRYADVNYPDIPELFGMEFVGGSAVPAGVKLDDPTGKVFNYFEDAKFLDYVNLMRDWSKKGYLHSNERLAKTDPPAKGSHFSIVSVEGAYKPGIEIDATATAGWPVVVKPAGTPVLTTSAVIATMNAINRNSKNPERAMAFLELLNTDSYLFNLINFGIEGTHYTLDNGFMVKSTSDENNLKYFPNVAWMFATNFMAIPAKGQASTIWEDTKTLNNTAQKSALFGFIFVADPVKNEIAKCGAVIDEYALAIRLGLVDEAKYKVFLDKLKKAGVDTITAEAQKQVDAFLAAKK